MPACRICLGKTSQEADFHPTCSRNLFGASALPQLDIGLETLNDLAQSMVGRMSISGVQQKAIVSLTPDNKRIEFTSSGGKYILKPPVNAFPEIPANEHVTMQMAPLVGIEIPRCGLLRLKDGNLAYIVRRFDRLDDGTKLPQEDFCQVAQLPPSDKYDQSAELCVRLLRQYATEPLVSILALYRLFLFAWHVGNGDLHLKNLSLVTTREGIRQLSPAYDLVCTKLVIDNDRMALTIGGKNSNLNRDDWIRFGEYCRIPPRAIEETLHRHHQAMDSMLDLVGRSFLSDEKKKKYQQIIRQNIATTAA